LSVKWQADLLSISHHYVGSADTHPSVSC